jgi:uncharacterized phage-associated protein
LSSLKLFMEGQGLVSMPHDARAVANFLLDYGASKGRFVTAMSLQKILFFAHAWHLAKNEKPLVGQPFEAWTYGPVNRAVYDQFKEFKDRPIEGRAQVLNAAAGRYETAQCRDMDEETAVLLQNIFDYYSEYHPYKLSDLTHEEGSPWDQVWNAAARRAVPGMVISNSSIRDWFQNNRQPFRVGRILDGPHDQAAYPGGAGPSPSYS